MESLTLNLYGIAPGDEQRYINAVIGLSLLRFDHKHQSKLLVNEMENNFYVNKF